MKKNDEFFQITVSSDKGIKNYYSRQVLIASGAANEIKIPSIAENISKDIKQLHTCEYKNAGQSSAGAVLVVGKEVYLSTSKVGRIPRWYRGRDIFYWILETKFYDIKAEELEDPKMLDARPPHVSGTGTGKDSLSLQSLAKQGAVILGKLRDADKNHVFFHPNAAEHIKYADEFSQEIKRRVDNYIIENNLPAPPPHDDEADLPDADAACASSITFLDLKENNINTIIWSTGFNADYSYIKLPVFDKDGKLKHKDGIPEIPGLYFLGYPWLRSRKSPILFGIIVDVQFVVDKIYSYAKEKFHPKSIGI